MVDAISPGNTNRVELLGTRGCHLCELAEDMLRVAAKASGVQWCYRDIAEDETLVARYAERIPVVRACNAELGWPFGPLDVLRLVRGEMD